MTGEDSTTNDPPSDGALDMSDDPRLAEVVDEYLQQLQSGARPDRNLFIYRYPELATAVAECLEGLDLVQGVVAPKQAATRDTTTGLPGAQPLGDFQIVRELARGGMGVVYEAIQLSLGRKVALKVLPFAATFDSRQLQRFKNEAQAAALLHHTHIVPIYAVGCERGVHFYAMQLIEGQSLAAVISQLRESTGRSSHDRRLDSTMDRQAKDSPRATFPEQAAGPSERSTVDISAALTSGGVIFSNTYFRRAARLIHQAADALEHAHEEGVIHRDIKPANLMVDTTGNLWITDFGLAQLQADNGLTRSGDIMGTFRYMSPEQTSGQRTVLDHRTDVYSLGVTLYELLALEPAFSGDSHHELLYKILHAEPRRLREVNRAVPLELETIVHKAMSKSPGDRYRTAAEFGADLQRYLDHQPILARRPTLIDRARKWSRRHPGVVVASMLVLALVTGLTLVSNRRITVEQQRTSAALKREKARAAEAEARFQQARQAVDALFQISEEELADKPMEGARKRILEVVLSYYQDFIELRAGDRASQAELAVVQEKVKGILRELTVIQNEMQTRLLQSEAVRKELKLSSEQDATLVPLVEQWQREHRELFEDRSQSEDARRARLVAMGEEHEQALAKLLTVAQRERFKQIGWQSQGIFAFKEPEVVKALQLTPAQRAQIREIEREAFARRFFLGPHPESRGPSPDRPAPEASRPNPPDVILKVLDILDESQKQTWQALTGEPFQDPLDEFPFGPFGPPPRR